MRNGIIFGALATAAAALLAPLQAAPITTPPPPLMALGGNVTAVYVFAGADNTSFLDEKSPSVFTGIFCNHPSGSCTGNMAGDTANLGTQSGSLIFGLRNVTSGKTYWTNMPDVDGNYHAVVSTDYSSFGLGALPSGAASVIAGLSNVTYVAWEDKEVSNGSDFDYNDLVFAFSNTAPNGNPGVPEPLTLSLMGAGLLGLAGMRSLRKKKA